MASVPQRYLVLVALALGVAGSVSAQSVAPKDSPFLPAPLQLTGVAVSSAGTRVCILVAKEQRSRWIAVGATVDGIRVASYDPKAQLAVISADGATRELRLQRGVAEGQDANPNPGTSPDAGAAQANSAPPANTATGETPSQREAHMLVSDLLDIGAQQRQAYANAQKAPAAPADGSK